MTNKIYDIFLDDKKIGTTLLEKADASMGVAFGNINFIDIISGYEFVRNFCLTKNIDLTFDYQDEKLISTRTIENLVVKNDRGTEIKCLGNQISGMDSDEFEITLEGIAYPFYEQEFPHHLKEYQDQFKDI